MGISGRIAALFQRNALTPLLALVLMLLGVFATIITPKEEEPQIDVTMADAPGKATITSAMVTSICGLSRRVGEGR